MVRRRCGVPLIVMGAVAFGTPFLSPVTAGKAAEAPLFLTPQASLVCAPTPQIRTHSASRHIQQPSFQVDNAPNFPTPGGGRGSAQSSQPPSLLSNDPTQMSSGLNIPQPSAQPVNNQKATSVQQPAQTSSNQGNSQVASATQPASNQGSVQAPAAKSLNTPQPSAQAADNQNATQLQQPTQSASNQDATQLQQPTQSASDQDVPQLQQPAQTNGSQDNVQAAPTAQAQQPAQLANGQDTVVGVSGPFSASIAWGNDMASAVTSPDGKLVTITISAPADTQISSYQVKLDWGDGTEANEEVGKDIQSKNFPLSSTHVYHQSGTFLINLTISDGKGSQMTATHKVIVP